MPWTLRARSLPHALWTDCRACADLAEVLSSSLMICHAAFRRTADLCLETKPRSRSRLRGNPARRFRQSQQLLFSEKFSGNDKYGTGSLVAREGSVALRASAKTSIRAGSRGWIWKACRRKASTCRFRPGSSRAGSRRITPIACCLLAGRDAGSAPDRPHRAHGDALRGARQGSARARRSAPRRAARWPSRARIARHRDRAGVRQP